MKRTGLSKTARAHARKLLSGELVSDNLGSQYHDAGRAWTLIDAILDEAKASRAYNDGCLPCPFCAGAARVSAIVRQGYRPYCLNCRACLGTFPTFEVAVERWNTRIGGGQK